jgi:hypothetical protein
MKKHIRNFLDFVIAWLVILPAFWLLINYSSLHEKIKELYFIVFKIPYYKGQGKFHPYVTRTDQ